MDAHRSTFFTVTFSDVMLWFIVAVPAPLQLVKADMPALFQIQAIF